MAAMKIAIGEADVASAGTAVQLSSTETHFRTVVFQAKGGNSVDVVLGDSGVVGAAGATRKGIALDATATAATSMITISAPGGEDSRKPAGMTQWIDLQDFYIDSPSSTPGVTWLGYN